MNAIGAALKAKTDVPGEGRRWVRVLAKYREPNAARSIFELVVTAAALVALWTAMWWALKVSYLLCLALAIPAGGFLVRLFVIQHDCGHGAFFRHRILNDTIGRALGVITLTPYDVWKNAHAIHHATSGNLERRGVGDITTMTVREYAEATPGARLRYRLYRHPIVMFGIGPAYLFLLQHRLPTGFMRSGAKPWISAMATNAFIAAAVAGLMWAVGVVPFLLVHLPIAVIGGSIGVWLFYVQHQFENTVWADNRSWDLPDAALYGSSYYKLPVWLRWLTASIGLHHVHHLCSRVPFYRLQEVMRDNPELSTVRPLTVAQSFGCVRLTLWDEGRQKLVSFRDALTSPTIVEPSPNA
jgi:omega-6 fatty acid desaturase (delta-12 desaturase)